MARVWSLISGLTSWPYVTDKFILLALKKGLALSLYYSFWSHRHEHKTEFFVDLKSGSSFSFLFTTVNDTLSFICAVIIHDLSLSLPFLNPSHLVFHHLSLLVNFTSYISLVLFTFSISTDRTWIQGQDSQLFQINVSYKIFYNTFNIQNKVTYNITKLTEKICK